MITVNIKKVFNNEDIRIIKEGMKAKFHIYELPIYYIKWGRKLEEKNYDNN